MQVLAAWHNVVLAVAALALAGTGSAASAKPAKPGASKAKPPADPMTEPVLQLKSWAAARGDNRDKPFMVIDKVAARVFVFDKAGAMLASSPALLGSALGDDAVAGIGDRELSDIAPADRTTPAGRFVSGFGRARGGRVLWIDYPTSISLHPVVTRNKAQRRPQRLASPTPEDNRITFGCINVPPPFYQKVTKLFGKANAIVYILPDTKPITEVFPSFAALAQRAPRLEKHED